MKATGLSLMLALLSVSCADGDDVCSDLEAHLEDCFGTIGSGMCDEAAAPDMLAMSCEELADLDAKQDGLLCESLGLFCDQLPIFPAPSGNPVAHPIVLAHGFNGSPENQWGVHAEIVEALRADGHPVYVARVAPFQSVATRAQQLSLEIDAALEEFSASRVNIIAHSMGGLDARYLISTLGYGDRVASLTTLSTPHHGSLLGNALSSAIPEVADKAVNAIASAFARTFTEAELAEGSDLRAALEDIATTSAADFNRENPDFPEVLYQSWAGVSNVARIANPKDEPSCLENGGSWHLQNGVRDAMSARLIPGSAIVAGGTALQPNDGMVTVESSRWGTFRGCIPADHYDEVGQINSPGLDRRTGFDATAFYRTIAFELATQGL